MTILQLTDRKGEMRLATPGKFIKQRVAVAAENLSLAGTLAARVELCNESLHKLVGLCYEVDSDGLCCNVDLFTYRILIPLPWGSSGWKSWGLRYHEAAVFRSIMLARQNPKAGQVIPLFVYDGGSRTWHLNVQDYPTPRTGKAWLSQSQVELSEWRHYSREYRNDATSKQRRYRTR